MSWGLENSNTKNTTFSWWFSESTKCKTRVLREKEKMFWSVRAVTLTSWFREAVGTFSCSTRFRLMILCSAPESIRAWIGKLTLLTHRIAMNWNFCQEKKLNYPTLSPGLLVVFFLLNRAGMNAGNGHPIHSTCRLWLQCSVAFPW